METEVKKEIKNLVIKRLESMPKTIKVSLGSIGELTKEELIGHVRKDDKLGKLIIRMQEEYLKSLKKEFA